jgi:hypothetical protein
MASVPPNALMRPVFFSSRQRDLSKYPSASDFTLPLPITLTNVQGISVRDFKYLPEKLINENTRKITVVSSGTTNTVQLTKGDYTTATLLTELNTKFLSYGVSFTVTEGVFTLAVSAGVNLYIPYCRLLRIIGFTTGIHIYATGQTPPSTLPANTKLYLNTAVAPYACNVNNSSDMILRITDVETVYGADAVTDRATAIIESSRASGAMVQQKQDRYTPLLQSQSRLQELHIKLLNSDGDLYDTDNYEVNFVIEFYCFLA